jgi:hypothetical protein
MSAQTFNILIPKLKLWTAFMLDTLATETFVSHLECGLRGDRCEADKIHGLSAAGRPLLVRYVNAEGTVSH